MNKLLKVKSIITFAITAVKCHLGVTGKVDPEKIIIIYTTIIGFYFGTQTKKDE